MVAPLLSMKNKLIILVALLSIGAGTNNIPKLEQAVQARKKIHEQIPVAAKPGEKPNDYGSPGRDKHDKGPPPGKDKP